MRFATAFSTQSNTTSVDCMLTIQNKMEAVATEIKRAFVEALLNGAFTFARQDCSNNGKDHHGNLMIQWWFLKNRNGNINIEDHNGLNKWIH